MKSAWRSCGALREWHCLSSQRTNLHYKTVIPYSSPRDVPRQCSNKSFLARRRGNSGFRHILKMTEQMNQPHDAKNCESTQRVPHSLPIEPPNTRKIRVDRLRSRVKQQEQQRTAEPRHLRAKESEGFLAGPGASQKDLFGRLIRSGAGKAGGEVPEKSEWP